MIIEGVEISHPEKIMYPEANVTKLDMIQYYAKIADTMLPYLKDRPLTLHRYPDGIDSNGFYQKKGAEYYPKFIKTIDVKTEEGQNTQILCNSKKALVYLANQGTIGFHTWLSKKDKLYKPDKVVFDLDPSSDSFERVKEAAFIIRDFLQERNIEPNVMTTGQHGIHVWYYIRRTQTFDELRPKLKGMAEAMETQNQDFFTTNIRKNKREGKIFIDYLRNAYAQTSVCPYSLRPNTEAGVAMPLEWKDLNDLKSANDFTIKNVQSLI